MDVSCCGVNKIAYPTFPIWVEPEVDPDPQCRDYNTLRLRRIYRVVMF